VVGSAVLNIILLFLQELFQRQSTADKRSRTGVTRALGVSYHRTADAMCN